MPELFFGDVAVLTKLIFKIRQESLDSAPDYEGFVQIKQGYGAKKPGSKVELC